MTGPEHYHEAEQLLADVRMIPALNDETSPVAALLIAEAQVHATLALAAADSLGRQHEQLVEGLDNALIKASHEDGV